MTSLAEKCDYLEKFTHRARPFQNRDARKRPFVPFRGAGNEAAPSKKKKKEQKKAKGKCGQQPAIPTNPRTPGLKKSYEETTNVTLTNGPSKLKSEATDFSVRDILKQRLHQKIEESRGQGPPKDPSSGEVQKKREKRKQERERKKRKKKELRLKKLAEKSSNGVVDKIEDAPAPQPAPTVKPERDTATIIFNKMETGENYTDKPTQKKEKKKRVKGCLTPLTGRNYKQLLTRVEQRKARLEELREKDEEKAKKEEDKMRWTNSLYKAEGMKIKDNEDLLRASLKKKEKREEQRKKKWNQRSQQVLDKMQRRQDKRRKNIQKRKQDKQENRKQKARKKGRVLPEDLKKVALQ
ncbi:surfeit locus protein 6 [Denticeps clupeoides]|uniref:Ribosomal RNA-processing protein 14/surfeit locus protein 6 C-terminal domain-containing protein n=1 Tax=Denticeps clupeoides TaxID=299321 RepID=A0AAY4AAE7_9TELE|nr:surfeit locus protein 6 [Denticeps clupeoides]